MTDPPILCLVRDLLFYSKIRAAAHAVAVDIKVIRDPAELSKESGCGLIVDLNQPAALEAACEWQTCNKKPVVGFVSHVDSNTIEAARIGGITQILARSRFEQNLPNILKELQHQKTPGEEVTRP